MTIFKRPSFNFGISAKKREREFPEGLWTKCPGCHEMIHHLSLEESLRVCPNCGYHMSFSAKERIASLVDEGSFQEHDSLMRSTDPLEFEGVSSYRNRLEVYQKKTGLIDAVVTGAASMGEHPIGLAVMDFRFLAATMGSVVGEKITRIIEHATAEQKPVIIFSASGGARMYEGMLGLMQLAKTSAALARHSEAGLPFISVLTHPTTGGVMASFAALGDLILAEPKSMIGFAGPRVIKETTHQELPEGFQKAEFLLEHGLIDQIVPRGQMRRRLIQCIEYLRPKQPSSHSSSS